MNFNKLSMQEKFGQMFIIGLDVYEINDEIIKLIKKYKIGGVVLYKKNYTSIETMIEVINKLKKINSKNKVPLFIAIDQENGRVNRLPKEINKIYNARKQSKCENIKVINSVNDITTYILKSVGVNMNFAPVLDIDKNIQNKAIGNRSYGSTKDDVITYGIPFMKCMQKNKVIPVIKHFPGHGATNKDSHIRVPYIKDVESVKNNDIIPFKEAIKDGADVVMIGHLRLKGYGFKPASINKKIIDELLIQNLNYDKVIMTDDLRMGLLRYRYGVKGLVLKSINAGNDIMMIKYKKGDTTFYKKLYKMVDNYEIDIERINNSAKKIVALKEKYEINDSEITTKLDIKAINKHIDKINELIDKEVGEYYDN